MGKEKGQKRAGRKYRYLTGLLVSVMIFACACGEKQNEQVPIPTPQLGTWSMTDSIYLGDKAEPVEKPEGWLISETIPERTAFGYAAEQALNLYQAGGRVCEAEDAVYYLVEADTGKISLNEQRMEDLSAINSYEIFWKDDIVCYNGHNGQLQYYDGMLYTVITTTESNPGQVLVRAILCGIDPEHPGDTMQDLQKQQLFSVEFDNGEPNSYPVTFLIHQGYVYFWHQIGVSSGGYDVYRDGKNCIYRVPLGSAEEPECVYAMESTGGMLVMKAYGDFIYVCDTSDGGCLYRINPENRLLEKLLPSSMIDDFFVADDGVYVYLEEEETISFLAFNDGTLAEVFDFDGKTPVAGSVEQRYQPYFDGTYWYVKYSYLDTYMYLRIYDISFSEVTDWLDSMDEIYFLRDYVLVFNIGVPIPNFVARPGIETVGQKKY